MGTSGLPTGPELAIAAEDSAEFVPHSKVGRIIVRGVPVMRGYENNPKANKEAFSPDGISA